MFAEELIIKDMYDRHIMSTFHPPIIVHDSPTEAMLNSSHNIIDKVTNKNS